MKKWFDAYGEKSWSTLGTLISMLIIGLILVIHPEGISNLLLNLVGGILLAAGLARIILYFMMDAHKAVDSYHLSGGLTMLFGGLVLIIFKGLLISLLPLLLGAIMLVGGAIRLEGALDMRRLGGKGTPVLVSSIVSILLGIVIILNPFSSAMLLMRVIGIALLLETVMDFTYAMRYRKWMEALGHYFR